MADLSQDERDERARVARIDAEALSWKNILSLKLKILDADKEKNRFSEKLKDLEADQLKNAAKYLDASNRVNNIEKEIERRRKLGQTNSSNAIKNLNRQLTQQPTQQQDLLKTAGGYYKAQEMAARKKRNDLTTERDLIKDINKQRGFGASFLGKSLLDMFRTKAQREKLIEEARVKAGGGPNVGGAGGGKGGGKDAAGVAAATGPAGIAVGLMAAGLEKLKTTVKAVGSEIKNQLSKPFAEAANLVNGGLGIGGGAVSGAGATSILGGLSNIANTIPFIGSLLGGLITGFKAVLDTVLGIDSANTRFAKSLGISKKDAVDLKKTYIDIANASGSIVVNQTRLMESQVELSQQLGVSNNLSSDILATNIELKEVLGLEVEARKSIAQSAIITGRNEKEITKSVLGQVALFKGLTGIGFNFKDILGEAAKQTGVMGLQFAKYPEKLTKALLSVKSLGMSLKQVDDIAGGLVDFESSISKEFEAQVLLGRNINLTKAREAALNNDLATVSSEITKNVGDAGSFLKLNRIQQDAIAQAVGMTRDSLADTLKQQEAFTKLGAKDLKQANEKIQVLQAQGKTQAEISKMLGEDAYNYITQTSTAERLTEVMNKIKLVFVEFVEKSGLIEFLTKEYL